MKMPTSLSRGYSLMELLVVLSLMAVISAIALPNLVGVYSSFSSRLTLDSLVSEINGVGYKAYEGGRGYVLVDSISNEQKSLPPNDVFKFTLEEGWRISVSQPIRYASNGACKGGELRIYFNDELMLSDRLAPPFCRINNT